MLKGYFLIFLTIPFRGLYQRSSCSLTACVKRDNMAWKKTLHVNNSRQNAKETCQKKNTCVLTCNWNYNTRANHSGKIYYFTEAYYIAHVYGLALLLLSLLVTTYTDYANNWTEKKTLLTATNLIVVEMKKALDVPNKKLW